MEALFASGQRWGVSLHFNKGLAGAGADDLHSGAYSFYFAVAANEIFDAGAGNDNIWAGDGDDTVLAGTGNDQSGGGKVVWAEFDGAPREVRTA